MRRWNLEDFVERFTELRRRNAGWTYAEVAREMGMSYKALDMAVRRARKLGYALPEAKGAPRVVSHTRTRQREVAQEITPALPTGQWRTRAVCRYAADQEPFFPSPNVAPTNRKVVKVVDDYCALCPVSTECLATGLAEAGSTGIWGGLLLPHQLDEIDTDKLMEELRERNP